MKLLIQVIVFLFSDPQKMDCHCDGEKRKITVLGTGCSGAIIIFRLSKKYHVEVYEAGIYRINDGATYNLAIGATASSVPTALVAPTKPTFTEPPPALQWQGLTFLPTWNSTTVPVYPPFIPVALRQAQTQGSVFGGSFEHIQGARVNPSRNRCSRWARILRDKRFQFKRLFLHIIKEEEFRMVTIPTVQTWDGTPFAPFFGPSALGSKPIYRGYNGIIQIMQSAPSIFSNNLAQAMYDYYHNIKGHEHFTNQPIVSVERESTTFNSGINACVTRATETYIDILRTRVSSARSFLNPSIIESTVPDQPSGNPGYTINPGPFIGINGHDIIMHLGTTVTRIIFETKCGYPEGQYYWIPNYTVKNIDVKGFKRPLRAIGIATTTESFIPINDLVVALGVYATPALMMLSGIGPRAVLKSLGLPVLVDQPNMGRHIGNHYGTTLRWTGDATKWGGMAVGTQNAHGYLAISENPIRRKFQFFSSAQTTIPPTWTMNLYDLTPLSTGYLTPTKVLNGRLLGINIVTGYYDLQIDRDNLCEVVRDVARAVLDRDPTATFILPNLPYPFPGNDVLFLALMQNFTQQAHYVGSCGMGNNPRYHCVTSEFLLRETENVYVCDGSSTPLEVDDEGHAYPIQNDGNTTGGIMPFAEIFSEQVLSH